MKPIKDPAKPDEAVVERDLGLGFITEQRLRFTIDRKKQVKELAAKGMSHRQIAKATGFSHQTVGRDLNGPNGPQNGSNGPPSDRELLSQSDQNDWRTPRKFLDAARAVMGAIDLDPASSAKLDRGVGKRR